MAAPHGHRRRNLNTGFSDFSTTEAFQDAQGGSPKSHNLDFDHDALGSTSCTFHNSLEPSILSIFENSSAEEAKIQIDEESEASLLSAFSEMLDSVIEDTLSPFDTIPDSKLFMGQRCQESRVRLHCLDREAAPRVTRSFTSSNLKPESLHSDRQLRPRLHRKTPVTTVQRSDGEDEDVSETRRRPIRIFRIESDPEMYEDEQQDGFLTVSLVDLVRHMHPYSLRVAADKKERLRDVEELQEEDVFVDVVGDETDGMHLANAPFGLDLEQKVPNPQSHVCKEDMLQICSPIFGKQKEEEIDAACIVTAKAGCSGRLKKKVRFAPDIASFHIYQIEDDTHEAEVPDAFSSEYPTPELKTADCDFQTLELNGNVTEVGVKTPSQNVNTKLKTLSLQEYRLLRQKTLPKEVRKTDYRTKWPLVSETPKELPPILCIPGYNSSQVNVQTPPSNAKTSTLGAVASSRRNPHLSLKSLPKQKALVRKPVQAVDPPNPVILSLQPEAKLSPPLSEEQKVMQQESGKLQADLTNLNPSSVQSSDIQKQPNFVTQAQTVMVSPGDTPGAKLKQTTCPSTIPDDVQTNTSAPSPPMTCIPVQVSQGNLPAVEIPKHSTEEKKQSAGEIGIEATDVTSLLEQFETQGLTPPATPPHQIWKPLAPAQKAKQHEVIKQSPNKTIQIIDPKPLPPSKIQSKPQPSSSIPAPSLFLAFIDHDYCITQDFKLGKKRALSDVHMHNRCKESRNRTSHTPMDNRSSSEAECLSGSVLLSPESSPCRLEARRMGEYTEVVEARRSHCSCSQSPRGRARIRHYRGRYHHSDSSSVSSSRSPSCSSSASSCSPPRKRYRSRQSESCSSSSSHSSSQSLSRSPIRDYRRRYRCSRSRSFSRSRSPSPHPDPRPKWSSWKKQRENYYLSRGEDARRAAKQKAIEERRVVYVGRICGTMTKEDLKERFTMFGKIEDCTVHFRSHGDNYGFVTYYNKDDAFAAIEKGMKLRQPDELPFDICFGGRRQFCRSNYMDLDSNRDMGPAPRKRKDSTVDFDTLLKQAQRGLKT